MYIGDSRAVLGRLRISSYLQDKFTAVRNQRCQEAFLQPQVEVFHVSRNHLSVDPLTQMLTAPGQYNRFNNKLMEMQNLFNVHGGVPRSEAGWLNLADFPNTAILSEDCPEMLPHHSKEIFQNLYKSEMKGNVTAANTKNKSGAIMAVLGRKVPNAACIYQKWCEENEDDPANQNTIIGRCMLLQTLMGNSFDTPTTVEETADLIYQVPVNTRINPIDPGVIMATMGKSYPAPRKIPGGARKAPNKIKYENPNEN